MHLLPCWPLASQPQRTCQETGPPATFPSSLSLAERQAVPNNWLVEVKCEDQGAGSQGLGIPVPHCTAATQQCTTAHRFPVISFILVLGFSFHPRAAWVGHPDGLWELGTVGRMPLKRN